MIKDCARCGAPFVARESAKTCSTKCAKAAKTESDRKWRAANPEREAENRRKWRAANPERKAEADRKWRAANPERKAESNQKWRDANPDYHFNKKNKEALQELKMAFARTLLRIRTSETDRS